MKSSVRLLAVSLFAASALAARAADDLKAMSGTWKPTKAELAGRPMPPPGLKSITLKMDGANYEVIVETEKGPSPDKGTVTIDSAAKPKGMTVTGVTGPNAGKSFPAIYELTGDTLRICYDLSGAARPTEFKTAPGTKLYLVDYERAK
jgi:uncharacterized protein (TIGR03067 family)